jgi:O-antigen ligase
VIPIKCWAAYCLMAASLAAAVLLKAGVHPQQWEWSALGISVAAILAVSTENDRAPGDKWGLGLMGVVLAWMAFQVAPLPAALVARLTHEHWHALAAARAATGQDPRAWMALSVAPSATIERLLDVIPAMAAFVAAREMAWWWRGRMWIVVAPIVGVAFFESLLGLAQFYFVRAAGGEVGPAAGTYANPDHFAGLLEMAFPVAVVLAISVWRKSVAQGNQTLGPPLWIALLLAISASLLAGVVVSLSRMGFISTLAAAALTMLLVPLSQANAHGARAGWRRAWRWVVPLALPLSILILLPTRELVLRFADLTSTQGLSRQDRVGIWRDTLQFIGAYKWTGCGLGAYEHGFYRYQAVDPAGTVNFAHNDYLQIVAELGIPGSLLVGFLAGWIVARTLAVVLWRRGASNWELAVGLFASLATIGLHSLADFNLYIPANALAFAWLSGVAVSPGLRRG